MLIRDRSRACCLKRAFCRVQTELQKLKSMSEIEASENEGFHDMLRAVRELAEGAKTIAMKSQAVSGRAKKKAEMAEGYAQNSQKASEEYRLSISIEVTTLTDKIGHMEYEMNERHIDGCLIEEFRDQLRKVREIAESARMIALMTQEVSERAREKAESAEESTRLSCEVANAGHQSPDFAQMVAGIFKEVSERCR
jgi:methyl-accepting chemotaxis protein